MSTTIYQIHRYSGDSENYDFEIYEDVIIGSYFKKSDAEAQVKSLKQQVQIELTKFNKCQNCPLYCFTIDNKNITDIKQQYCDKFELSKTDEENYETCNNETMDIMGLDNIPTYEIVEVEVN